MTVLNRKLVMIQLKQSIYTIHVRLRWKLNYVMLITPKIRIFIFINIFLFVM